MKKWLTYLFSAIIVSFLLFQSGMAIGPSTNNPIISGNSSGVYCDLPGRATAWKISLPDGSAIQSESLTISVDDVLPDGHYGYEIIGYLEGEGVQDIRIKEEMNNGRENTARPSGISVGVIESGSFRIAGGIVIEKDLVEE